MPLHSEHGGHGPRLVLMHGFTQTGRCWGPVGERLARGYEVIRLDAPGHGGSSDVQADLVETAGLAAEATGPEPAVYVSYSMGARMALHVALGYPEVVRALVMVGGTAGIPDDDERAARHERDRALAQELRDRGVDAFLDGWLAQPLFKDLPGWARFDEERRRNTADGLAGSLELAGTGSQAPRWDDLDQLAMPVLLVAGADDARYAEIAGGMSRRIGPNAEVALVPDAGHAAHLEQPDRFLELLLPWLGQPESQRPTATNRPKPS
ncbi:MAG: alpha/beta fold hydrolase [Acidimicrobiales bacterium]